MPAAGLAERFTRRLLLFQQVSLHQNPRFRRVSTLRARAIDCRRHVVVLRAALNAAVDEPGRRNQRGIDLRVRPPETFDR